MAIDRKWINILEDEMGYTKINKVIYKYYDEHYIVINERGIIYIADMVTVLNTDGNIEINFNITFRPNNQKTYDKFMVDIDILEKKYNEKIYILAK